MKIYTKTGDAGETSLLGGRRVSKADIKIDAYGTVDELNSWIGFIADQIPDLELRTFLRNIQSHLFVIGSNLATDKEIKNLQNIENQDIENLEQAIDTESANLSELKNFILPGGSTTVSYCHIARAVCRRAERIVVALTEHQHVDDVVLKYLNRLSDYLFILARKIAKNENIEEVEWKGVNN